VDRGLVGHAIGFDDIERWREDVGDEILAWMPIEATRPRVTTTPKSSVRREIESLNINNLVN
jgi:hypothetical protein